VDQWSSRQVYAVRMFPFTSAVLRSHKTYHRTSQENVQQRPSLHVDGVLLLPPMTLFRWLCFEIVQVCKRRDLPQIAFPTGAIVGPTNVARLAQCWQTTLGQDWDVPRINVGPTMAGRQTSCLAQRRTDIGPT